jgi:hypothetical protein
VVAARWRHWLSLFILTIGWWGLWSAEVQGVTRDACRTDQIKDPVADTSIRFHHHRRTYVEAQVSTTVKMPVKGWVHAPDLMLSEESAGYRAAMRCLFRGPEEVLPGRKDEWRFQSPEVTAQRGWITVRYEAVAWINHAGPLRVGPWRISVGEKNWLIELQPPKALVNVKWNRIEVKLGDLDALRVRPPAASAGSGSLVWTEQWPLTVRIDLEPPWQGSFATRAPRQASSSQVRIASWWGFASLVIVVAAVSYRWPPQQASSRWWTRWQIRRDDGSGPSKSLARAALEWAVLSAAVALTLLLVIPGVPTADVQPRYTLISIAAGLVMILVARPWSPDPTQDARGSTAEGPADLKGARRRQAGAVMTAAAGVAAVAVSVALAPGLFGLPNLTPKTPLPASALLGLALMGTAVMWLWLAAMTAWAWRFAQEGGLAKNLRSAWEKSPILWVGAVGAALLVMTGAMLACFWWAHERQWERQNWLSGGTANLHDIDRSVFFSVFPATGLRWIYSYAWVLAGVAFLALLRTRVRAERPEGDLPPELEPVRQDFLLVSVLFAFVVGLRQVPLAGSATLYGVWLPLTILSLYALRAVTGRWSVLARTQERFRPTGPGAAAYRERLLEKAHLYRNAHHQLLLTDRSHEGSEQRKELESQLRDMHQWLRAESSDCRLPDRVSVLDVALSWGPKDHWWDNARHAARLAFWFGIPATIALTWLDYLRDSRTWLLTQHSPIGLLEIAASLAVWQLAWAAAGFCMGALWRVLPGSRGPVRAVAVTVAYAAPIGVGALFISIADTNGGYALLNVILMLSVLTLTSIWMDMATFSGERKFWPTRLGLLLSIYQLRGMSAQIAYLLAQMGIAASIWSQLAARGGDPP